MKRALPKTLIIIAAVYFMIGFAYGIYVQIKADPNDPPPIPIWAPGLSLGERLGAFLIGFVFPALFWPLFLPPTLWCLFKNTC